MVTEYKNREKLPPDAYLIKCERPFDRPPQVFGEGMERDPIWLQHFTLCANQIEQLREYYRSRDPTRADADH
ncbi:hypothetical protein BZJ19_10085 [Salinivibrio proteolyticus]|nr:hypothetical protein BZJ19_10085 [Salinivibrio proteolyticus]